MITLILTIIQNQILIEILITLAILTLKAK